MAFVVEDGNGLSNSNAYVSVAFSDDYHADRGRTDWAGASSQNKQTAIVRATDYIDRRFGTKFRGTRQNKSQALEWPRLDALDNDEFLLNDIDDIPRQLQKACAEYALIALRIGELTPRPKLPVPQEGLDGSITNSENSSGEIKSISQKVGPVSETIEYAAKSEQSASNVSSKSSLVSDWVLPEYPVADLLIQELLTNSISKRLVRS